MHPYFFALQASLESLGFLQNEARPDDLPAEELLKKLASLSPTLEYRYLKALAYLAACFHFLQFFWKFKPDETAGECSTFTPLPFNGIESDSFSGADAQRS